MTLFDTLTQPQQQLLLGEKADRGTRKALFARGLITECDESGVRTATLTDLGRMVLFEHAQRDNRVKHFPQGTRVVVFDWQHETNGLAFTGQHAVAVYPTLIMVTVVLANGDLKRVNPRSLALLSDIEAEGLIHMVQR